MRYTVHIRNNETGEVREFHDDLEWEDHFDYWWSEGNMSCDCNRELCFAQAGGQKINLDDPRCGDSRFSVVKIVLDSGEEVPFDDTRRGL